MNRTKVKINKPMYSGLLILDISKIVMCEYWYDYVKPKYRDKAKLYCTDTNSCIVHVKSEDVYADLTRDVEKGFDTSQ